MAEEAAPAVRVDEFPLHECVFRGDVRDLSALIRKGETDLSLRDPHGNTALHLAAMLGRRECVHLLCAHGAPVKIKNKMGWSPLAEAVRYRKTRLKITSVLTRVIKSVSRLRISKSIDAG
jgi:ankyrin repeat protein